jgi:hypothetical protein
LCAALAVVQWPYMVDDNSRRTKMTRPDRLKSTQLNTLNHL